MRSAILSVANVVPICCATCGCLPAITPDHQLGQNHQHPRQLREEIAEDDVIKVNTNLARLRWLSGATEVMTGAAIFHVLKTAWSRLAFFAAVDEPFTIALLIDNSRSDFALRDILDAAVTLVDQLRTSDRALVISYIDLKTIVGPTTQGRADRQSQISNLAGARVCTMHSILRSITTAAIKGRRAIVL